LGIHVKEFEMADLSTEKRKDLTKAQFGLPSRVDKGKEKENAAGRGAYPMPDRRHAANAKARAEQEYEKGKLSRSDKEKIDAKANRVLERTAKGKDKLSTGTSAAARSKNIATEIRAGKDPKQAAAIAYATQRRNIAKKGARSRDEDSDPKEIASKLHAVLKRICEKS
jgi:hypothetical protein